MQGTTCYHSVKLKTTGILLKGRDLRILHRPQIEKLQAYQIQLLHLKSLSQSK